MSSNAFCRSLEFAFPDPAGTVFRLFGSRLVRIVSRADGRWLVVPARGEAVTAELRAGWIAGGGRLVGLSWKTSDARRHDCALYCCRPAAPGWRRLLVRLRVPMRAPLT